MTITVEVTLQKLVDESKILADGNSQSLYEAGFRLGAAAAIQWFVSGNGKPSELIEKGLP